MNHPTESPNNQSSINLRKLLSTLTDSYKNDIISKKKSLSDTFNLTEGAERYLYRLILKEQSELQTSINIRNLNHPETKEVKQSNPNLINQISNKLKSWQLLKKS